MKIEVKNLRLIKIMIRLYASMSKIAIISFFMSLFLNKREPI